MPEHDLMKETKDKLLEREKENQCGRLYYCFLLFAVFSRRPRYVPAHCKWEECNSLKSC